MWLTPFDGNGQMNFWGALKANVPEGMARWWEIADSDSADTRFVNAWSADGEGRWEEHDLDLGLTRLRKELGLRGKGDFLPDEEGWLAEAKIVALTEDYERELAAALGGLRKGSAPRPKIDPHAPWREREDRTIVRKAQSLVDAAPAVLTSLRDRLDFAEVLWRTGKRKRAREVLAALRPSRDDVGLLLELGAPADLLEANVRYLPDFALELARSGRRLPPAAR